jgi:hypothetical protein
MHTGQFLFAQILDLVPRHEFNRCVERYEGRRRRGSFSCWDQFLCLAFAQLTYRESLRDIEACLRAVPSRLYHLGFRGRVSRATLADANERRDWRIFADFAQVLIALAQPLYRDDPLGFELDATVYALDSTTIDLCLTLFPWAPFQQSKAAVKMHTLLELHGNIPNFIHVSDAHTGDVSVLDLLAIQPGAFYVMDRGYIDFKRMHKIQRAGGFFILRTRKNLKCKGRYTHTVDKSTGICLDQAVALTGVTSSIDYPELLRRVRFMNTEGDEKITVLTNAFELPVLTIAHLYKKRWQVELFFKWIKQHLRIKAFYGTSINAVKTQIWIAVTVYVLVALLKKRFNLPQSLYTILQILSVTLFEKTPILQAFSDMPYNIDEIPDPRQLILFDLQSGQ